MKNKKSITLALILNIALLLFLLIMNDVTSSQNVFVDNSIGESVYFIGCGVLLFISMGFLVAYNHFEGIQRKTRIVYPIVSGLIAASIATLAFVYASMFPFGDHNIMMVDMWGQYTPMLEDFKMLLQGDGSWFYTNQIGLGTGYLPLFGYYLASPFNLLLVFFPIEYLPQAFMLITILKIACCASAFTICMQYIVDEFHLSSITCGIMYSGMFFILAYSWCIMWMDALILLPLCICLLERMLKTRKIVGYSVCLGLTIASNFYMAFIVCIFLCLYWLVWVVREKRSQKQIIQAVELFALGSILGGGLSAIITLPVVIGLQGTSAANDSIPAWKELMPLFEIPNQMLYNAQLTIRSKDYANIGCGILALVSVPLYFSVESISKRKKYAYAALLYLLVLSFGINRLDLVWHGFHTPNDLPYRYSFIFSFVCLLMTCEFLQKFETCKLSNIYKIAGVCVIWLVIADSIKEDGFSFSIYFVSLGLMILYFSLIAIGTKIKEKSMFQIVLLFLVVLEVLSQSSVHRFQMNSQEGYGSHNNWASGENIARQSVANHFNTLSEDVFKRSEMLPLMTFQDSALFDYDGISSFASTYYYTTTKTMKNLGYESNGINSSVYRSYMPTVDSLLGIRYIALRSELNNYTGLNKIENVDLSQTGWYLYENETYLSLGYAGTSKLRDYTSTIYDPVKTQNDLYTALSGDDSPVLLLSPIKAVDNDDFMANEITVDDTSFGIPNKGENSVGKFEIELKHDGHTFIYVDCSAADDIRVQGVSSWDYPQNKPYFIDNSHRLQGDKVTVEITSEGVSGNIYVATIDDEVFKNAIDTIRNNQLDVTVWKDGYMEAIVDVEQDGVLMLSIPYDKGWNIWIDGEKSSAFAIDNSLMGTNIRAGHHAIKMSYTPPGLMIGGIISGISILLLITLGWIYNKRNKHVQGEHL